MRPVAHMGENVGIFIEKQTIEAIHAHFADLADMYLVLAAALYHSMRTIINEIRRFFPPRRLLRWMKILRLLFRR